MQDCNNLLILYTTINTDGEDDMDVDKIIIKETVSALTLWYSSAPWSQEQSAGCPLVSDQTKSKCFSYDVTE